MNRFTRAGAVLSLALLGAGCDDFLQGPGYTETPNDPLTASATAQFVAMQANMFRLLEGQLARLSGIYTQQLIGSNNQQQAWGTEYGVTEADVNVFFNGFYTGAGLLALRNVQAAANAAGDAKLEGIAKIWEAYAFGTAASIWGDIPYSEAGAPDEVDTPELDSQEEVYTAVLALLDEGITLLTDAGTGPGASDLIYGGNVDRWRRAAYTLKARFHLHLAERQGTTAYQAAVAAANLGIDEAPANAAQAMHGQAPGDFRALHGNAANVDANIWQQFLQARQDIVAGDALVQVLKARNDPRLTAYFDPNTSGQVTGMSADRALVGTGPASVVNTSVRRQPTFRQPLVTWAENQLILAEAKHRLGDVVGATGHVNAVRMAVGLPPLLLATFQDVALEKYIAMFQNVDVWSDWKRMCTPLIKPFSTRAEVIGRLPYGANERTSNPNIPLPSAYPTGTTGSSPVRNWNDPSPCPRP
jgi:hypothetical protein